MSLLKICRCKLKPLLEVLLMSLIITMAILLLLILLYVKYLITKDDDTNSGDDDSLVPPTPIYSYGTRVAGLIEKIYPDENIHNKKLLCNGLIVQKQTVVFLADCFRRSREKTPTKYVHFITSGSKYWHHDRNIHHVTDFSTIGTAGKEITVIKVWPDFPLTRMGLPNKIYVENEYKYDEKHRLLGWDINSKRASTPLKNILYVEECRPNMLSGILFTENSLVSGLHYVDCSIGDLDTFVPFPTDEVEKNYPEINVVRIPKQGEQSQSEKAKEDTEAANPAKTPETDTDTTAEATDSIPTESTDTIPSKSSDTDTIPSESTDSNPSQSSDSDSNPSESTDSNPSESTDSNPSESTDSNPSESTDSNPSQSTDSLPTESLLIFEVVPTPNNMIPRNKFHNCFLRMY
ncbi:uncharacterized protein LOC130896534 [Diorhabda carinulata]|uniref:uncharacterized protein LOC130896534 n=1 Tax=Diorhabda carinulata TaxID=1163345 RepID=UPI0025A21ED1|nr:uncharacterized protein LOC130896534 [Diorhabda carinulata]